MKKIFSFLLLACSYGTACIAQDYSPRLSIATELALDLVKEYNISVEYKFSPRLSLGIMPALVRPSEKLAVYGLSPSQDKYPGKVYGGYSLRAFLKYHLAPKPNRYFAAMLVYRNIGYDSVSFLDMEHKDGYNYSRNERTAVYGIDLLYGIELGKYRERHFFSDFYFGLGFRLRQRQYTTYKSEGSRYNYAPGTKIPLGSYSLDQQYPTLVLGFKIGGSIHNKKAR